MEKYNQSSINHRINVLLSILPTSKINVTYYWIKYMQMFKINNNNYSELF